MRILNLSLDTKALENGSAVQQRLIALAEKVGEMTVFVPAERDRTEKISEHLTVFSFGGLKLIQLWKMWRVGKRLFTFHFSLSTRVDLITVQDPYFLGILGVKLSEKTGIPLEVQVHGLEKFSGIRKHVAKYVLQYAAKIRVVSERLKSFLNSEFSIQNSEFLYKTFGNSCLIYVARFGPNCFKF